MKIVIIAIVVIVVLGLIKNSDIVHEIFMNFFNRH